MSILCTRRLTVSPRVALPLCGMANRSMTTATGKTRTRRKAKAEGSIADIFTTLTGEEHNTLPARFSDLKKELWKDSLVESWREVLEALPAAVEEIASTGSEIVPRIRYEDLKVGLSAEKVNEIRKIGTVIITGGIPKEEALGWKQAIRDYVAANSDRVKGFPEDNIQVFEIYNSLAQTQARTHPTLINTQRFLLNLWSLYDPDKADLNTPISYFDRLRIRQPGDAKFTLGPHIDGGSVERWEDVGLRKVFEKILEGGSQWRKHDPFMIFPRLKAKQDMYNTPNACSIFRPWQGWTSLSSTGPGEGTLRVLPMLSLASAYIILRPFFRPLNSQSQSLKFEDWVVDMESPYFPGSSIGKTQELNEKTHPHLQLARTMVSIPRVEPGDQVYWHCDTVHAVESHHGGKGDSSVFYIPAVPWTEDNARYLEDQLSNFREGLPPPDFPGGEGESRFVGRGLVSDISTKDGRSLYGLGPERWKSVLSADSRYSRERITTDE